MLVGPPHNPLTLLTLLSLLVLLPLLTLAGAPWLLWDIWLHGLRSKKWVDWSGWYPLDWYGIDFWSTCVAKKQFVGRNNLTQVCISWDVLNFILFWSFIWCRIWFPFGGDAKKMSKVSIYLWNHGLHCGSFITSLLACIDFNKNDCMHGLRWFVRACLGQFIH